MIGLCEFLNTVNQEKFISLLRKEFISDIRMVTSLGNCKDKYIKDSFDSWGKETIIFRCIDKYLDYETEHHLVEFCRKFNYVCSMRNYDIYLIEPIQSQKQVSGKIVYHITNEKIWNDIISKKGLKCRGNKYREWNDIDMNLLNNPSIYHFGNQNHSNRDYSYRSITPRIYVVAIRSNRLIYTIASQIGKTGQSGCKDGVVLKIDLKSHPNIKLYSDNCNPENYKAYYTLEDIPVDIIKVDNRLTELIRKEKFDDTRN